jgi:hypothetical protein
VREKWPKAQYTSTLLTRSGELSSFSLFLARHFFLLDTVANRSLRESRRRRAKEEAKKKATESKRDEESEEEPEEEEEED